MMDRESLRAQALEFLRTPAFERHYNKLHVSRAAWLAAVCIATVTGVNKGIRVLKARRSLSFDSPKLRRAYQELGEKGRVVRAFLVMNNSTLSRDPQACAPALVVASLEGTDSGDAAAEAVHDKLFERLLLLDPTGPGEMAVSALMNDEEYIPWRKRRLPDEFTEGREAYFMDVKIDNELLQGNSLMSAGRLYFLVDPSPNGLVLQIPQAEDSIIVMEIDEPHR